MTQSNNIAVDLVEHPEVIRACLHVRSLITELETWDSELLDWFRSTPHAKLLREWLGSPRLAHQPPAACELSSLEQALVDDPDNICAGIPDAAIQQGIDAWDGAMMEMRERDQSEHPENFRDWDEGMLIATVFKAVGRSVAALSSAPVAPVGEGLREALEKCRSQFQFYADEPFNAGKLEKAATNQTFADMCEKALSARATQPLPGKV
jgi:hypothetical protein